MPHITRLVTERGPIKIEDLNNTEDLAWHHMENSFSPSSSIRYESAILICSDH